MTRTHRAVHRLLWPTLALTVAIGFTLALALRAPPESPEPPPAQSEPAK